MVCESPGHGPACALVGAGIGMAMVPEMVAATARTHLSARGLEAAPLRRTISVVHPGDRASGPTATLCALPRDGFRRAAGQ
ncbi:LysR substrate-binding domain-containing protein [Streptomyces sp. NBC_01718]|nr:LysR substrate-binding domain-containing protein [Streptomyces sp. NBC_01727]